MVFKTISPLGTQMQKICGSFILIVKNLRSRCRMLFNNEYQLFVGELI